MYTIDIDTGGTFTDGYVVGKNRDISVKVDTTPHDLTECFFKCIEEAAGQLDVKPAELLNETRIIRFSSTIATNTAVQLSGPKLGLIVTEGNESALYSPNGSNPAFTFVSPELVVGIAEETDDKGRVRAEPTAEQVDEGVRHLLENGARMIVISLRNAHANPANELLVRRYIDSAYPRHYLGAVPMLLSHQVTTIPDQSLRTNTALVNGYFHRELVRSLYKAEDIVRRQNYWYPLMVATADYGVTRVAKTKAISTYQSGPASAVRGAYVLAKTLKHRNVVTIDVGGTTTDASLIANGAPIAAVFRPIRGVEVAQRIPEIVSFGVGGGSRIVLGGDDTISVGPDSQGAVPGPACFGLGGSIATPTDVWLTLGYLDPKHYLGGRKALASDKARTVIKTNLATPLGVDVPTAALMAKTAVEQSLAKQILADPALAPVGKSRDVTLYSVGGGAGLMAVGLAEELGLGSVYCPANAAVFSAFGASTLDVTHSYEEILSAAQARAAAKRNDTILESLKEQAERDMRGEGFDAKEISYSVEVECLKGLGVVGNAGPLKAARGLPKKAAALLGQPPKGTEYVIVRLIASCAVPHPPLASGGKRKASVAKARVGARKVRLGDKPENATVYSFDALPLNSKVNGPALIENEHTSILVPGHRTFTLDEYGNGSVRLD